MMHTGGCTFGVKQLLCQIGALCCHAGRAEGQVLSNRGVALPLLFRLLLLLAGACCTRCCSTVLYGAAARGRCSGGLCVQTTKLSAHVRMRHR